MTIAVSTGLRTAMLGTGSLKGALDAGFIHVYGGTPPTDADASDGGATPLVTITESGDGVTGLTFDAAANGSMAKAAAETWSGTIDVTGTATWYRHVGASDTGATSTTEPRIQGDVSTAGAALNLTSTALVAASSQTIDYYTVTLPTAAL